MSSLSRQISAAVVGIFGVDVDGYLYPDPANPDDKPWYLIAIRFNESDEYDERTMILNTIITDGIEFIQCEIPAYSCEGKPTVTISEDYDGYQIRALMHYTPKDGQHEKIIAAIQEWAGKTI